MATRNISYGSAPAAHKDTESGQKDTHSVSKRCESLKGEVYYLGLVNIGSKRTLVRTASRLKFKNR